jgi:nickel/cobalt exporter
MSVIRRYALVVAGLAAALLLCACLVPCAQADFAHHPFAVGANEGAVRAQSGLGAWILAQESVFYRGLTAAVRGVRGGGGGLWLLLSLSFAYGVFHAAGPGHGKAVITSYLVSNELALRRGFLIALAAAILQAIIATALVAVAAFLFNATAAHMSEAARIAELCSYAGIVALGVTLVWRKGRALAAALRPVPAPLPLAFLAVGAPLDAAIVHLSGGGSGRFRADNGVALDHGPDCACGHAHMPAPDLFATRRFDWKAAGLAIATAGARPCSGAILVLIFALAQGLFLAGVAATFAMALGTAITTGALATFAVLAKDSAMRLLGGRGSSRGVMVARAIEFGAALCVLAFGLLLLSSLVAGTAGSV